MNDYISTSSEHTTRQGKTWLLLLGIILIAANLRAPLTSVGSLISFIRDDLGLNNGMVGMITTLPLLAFALLSPFAPRIANRIGIERTIFISLLLLTCGMIIRSILGTAFLFGGTIIIGMAIAFGNVLLPGFIKMNFPLKVGVMTGIYSVSMTLVGALASGLSVPFLSIDGIGWKSSLVFWGILSVIALLVWIPQLGKQDNIKSTQAEYSPSGERKSIWKSPLAWSITVFMGMQSLMFYTMVAWLPEILQTSGYSSSASGWMLFLMQFVLIPTTFITPVIAERMTNQKALSAVTAALFFLGTIGLLLGGGLPIIVMSAILIGIGAGSAFSLSMMFFSLRTKDGKQAAEMSGMAQSFGYLLAAIGPTMFGMLRDITEGWTVPLMTLLVVAVIILVAGVRSGKNSVISDTTSSNAQWVEAG